MEKVDPHQMRFEGMNERRGIICGVDWMWPV